MTKIKVIPATINPITKLLNSDLRKRRVCGYARVSTDSDEQFTSYEAQIDYYTQYITANSGWEFAGVYTDEGITGTSTKNREGFKKMIKDAIEGKIDLIVTKSISRFARNTVDTLVTIRQLKEKGVECFFEKENIYTFDSKGELLITIMSSLAQEESRSISENVTWGHRKSFSDGKVHVAYSTFLGFTKGENGRLKIVEEEAKTVRFIYRLFLDGQTPSGICKYLDDNKIATPGDKKKWHQTTVNSILMNEKYKGDALLQKTFTLDFLTGKSKKNEGEVQQYYVEKSHEAIIDPREWDMVQLEMKRRKQIGQAYSAQSPFTNRLVCGDCGEYYGPKVWNSNDKYRKVVWQCNHKFKNVHRCKTPALSEATIKDEFVKAYNKYAIDKEQILTDLRSSLEWTFDTAALQEQIDKVMIELEAVSLLVRKLIDENSAVTMSQIEYKKKYETLEQNYNDKRVVLDRLLTDKADIDGRKTEMLIFIEQFNKAPEVINEWDQTLWNLFVIKAVVEQNGTINFKFKA
jgi:site-specific DNA recombinase